MNPWDRGAVSSILQIRKHSVVSQDISYATKMKRDKLYQLSRSIVLGTYPSPLTTGGREGRKTAWSQDLWILASLASFPQDTREAGPKSHPLFLWELCWGLPPASAFVPSASLSASSFSVWQGGEVDALGSVTV